MRRRKRIKDLRHFTTEFGEMWRSEVGDGKLGRSSMMLLMQISPL
jgi:hypothetical protein